MDGLQDEFAIIKSFIAITKGGLGTVQLMKEYRQEMGSPLNFRKYGFPDLLSMLSACPEIKVYQTPNGPMCQVVDEKISHITSLVNRTRPAKKRPKKSNYFNRQRRPSYCTTARSLNSPQRDLRYKSGGTSSPHRPGNFRPIHYGHSSKSYQDTYQSNSQRSYVQNQERERNNLKISAQPTNSLNSGSKVVKDNQSGKNHLFLKGQSVNKQDPRTNSHQPESSSSSTKSQSSWSSDPSIGEKAIYHSKTPVGPNNASSDSDWSSDSDSNQEPARAVQSSIKQLRPSITVQSNTVSSSSRSKAPNKKKAYHSQERACSFGARDVRYLSESKNSIVHSQNTEKAQTSLDQQQTGSSIHQQPSTSSLHLQPSTGLPQSSSKVVGCVTGTKPKSVAYAGNRYIKTSTQAEEQICRQPSPDSDEAITVGNSPSKRVTSATLRNGVQTILVKVPNRNNARSEVVERSVLNTCEPRFGGFQFIGDFLLTRVAEVCLPSTIHKEGNISYCGLCRDDLTISECEEAIMREGTSGKVVLMIGMTDIMQGSSLEEMKRDTRSLLERLKYNSVLLITLPVPPSFVRSGNERKLMVLEMFNKWLLNFNQNQTCCIDIDSHLYSDPPFFERVPYLNVEIFSEEGAWIVMDAIVSALR
ncbi:Tudor domain-containing protein 5 [Frankliniella fusca]|uniref:Tudor domain-containing protein 5 n=1 Tax=Frankliniella fusca TaxID=407009 RepID=A0AAE1L5J3_9NEOP|nr:Tudor domain-containing protein 5 [Frankliniella fusca]